MAQTVSIAPALTAASGGADINVPANERWIIGIYTDHANGFEALLPEQGIQVLIDTPSSADTIVCTLNRAMPSVVIPGKCTVRTKRIAQPATAVANIGVFVNDQT